MRLKRAAPLLLRVTEGALRSVVRAGVVSYAHDARMAAR